MQKITPFLWFDGRAEEAMNLYTSIFRNSRVDQVMRYPKGSPAPEGSVMSANFTLDGTAFIALNGGPHFKFTPAVSFFIQCEDQAEIDHYWNGLLEGGQAQQCGWLTDRFGISWQVVPRELGALLQDPDRAKAGRTMEAMMKMIKLDIAALKRAHAG